MNFGLDLQSAMDVLVAINSNLARVADALEDYVYEEQGVEIEVVQNHKPPANVSSQLPDHWEPPAGSDPFLPDPRC